jgi:hypothetical protein
MPDIYPPTKQRVAILAFAEASTPHRPHCAVTSAATGASVANTGKVFAMATIGKASVSGFGIYIERSTSRAWTAVKSKLQFWRLRSQAVTGLTGGHQRRNSVRLSPMVRRRKEPPGRSGPCDRRQSPGRQSRASS